MIVLCRSLLLMLPVLVASIVVILMVASIGRLHDTAVLCINVHLGAALDYRYTAVDRQKEEGQQRASEAAGTATAAECITTVLIRSIASNS